MPEGITTNQTTTKTDNVGWYQLSADDATKRLGIRADEGLSDKDVELSRQQHGRNQLTEKQAETIFSRFFRQFKNPLIIILLVAGLATLLLGEYTDTIVIFVALLINVVIGTFQEERASQAFAKLSESQDTEATVIRNGRKQIIPATEVVVGDVVALEPGMFVPADLRLLDENNLKINEAALTGEWMEVAKQVEKIDETASVPDQTNMAWKGTLVSSGDGHGVVVAIGDGTELGKIAEELTSELDHETPIQRHMRKVARLLSIISLAVVALIFILGMIRSLEVVEMLLVAIAVAVSVVPEGLPAAVTVVLAIGMEKILDKGGLVKNLRAAETLGSTTVIMTDKTGTLTQAKMEVADLISFDQLMGELSSDTEKEANQPVLSPLQLHLLEAAVTSSDAFVEREGGQPVVRGRAIEKAIVSRGLAADFDKTAIDQRRHDFITFSSENRYAASLSTPETDPAETAENAIFISGAPEFVLSHATRIRTADGTKEIDESLHKQIKQAQDAKSSEGKRLIALAYKATSSKKIERATEGAATKEQISDLVFLGLVSFVDPIRSDVAESIAQAQSAGVHVVMVTGDNQETARFIAKQAGIANETVDPVTGTELDEMSDEEIVSAIKTRTVFARVLPDQKLRIANLLHKDREVVAMTGDGVNDAPALRAADIGVAVGSGTEVAKEASDLVLLDNSFSIIVSAIEEGRRIIDNLKKIIVHLLSAGFGEVFLITGALLLALPIPITAPQILWINIVQGGLLSFVFAFEPPAPDIMKRNPQTEKVKELITSPVRWLIIASGVITGLAAFIVYLLLESSGLAIEQIYTVMFFILAIDTLFFTLSLKDFYRPIYKIDFSNNVFLFFALFLSVAAMLAAVFVPALRELLSLTVPVGWMWWLLLGIGLFDLAVVEVAKYVLFQRRQK